MAKKQEIERLPHEYFPPITFTASGVDVPAQQSNLIQARQSPAYTYVMALIAEALTRRCDVISLDYTAQGVAVTFSIDGFGMQMPPRDRATGDAMLAGFKKIADLNVAERRAKQEGKFGTEFMGTKYTVFLTSQGVPTGERVVFKIVPKKFKFASLEEVGMRDKLREQFKKTLDSPPGWIIISAPPLGGLTTSWKVGLEAADRFVRDFVSVEDKQTTDEEIININRHKFDKAGGETPDKVLPGLLLKQPDALVVPEPMNAETMKLLSDFVTKEQKMVVTRTQAKECVEALLRTMMLKPPMPDFAKAVTMVFNQRLIRRLCDCKQGYQPPPQLLQKLGIPPGRVTVLYDIWKPPPPDPNAKKGEEPQICQKCGGIGYYGRIAICEVLMINDQIREALIKQPKLEVLREVAKQSGHRSIQDEAILLLVKGITSLAELQRVLKQ